MAPRPTMTPAQPVRSNIDSMLCGLSAPPLPTTGIETAATARSTRRQSAGSW